MRKGRWRRVVAALGVVVSAACENSPMAKIKAVRDGLAEGNAAASWDGIPACEEMPPVALGPSQPSPREKGCLTAIATALGSKDGFHLTPIDQASAATGAIVLARHQRGDWLAHADLWLDPVKTGTGTGTDALRLAIANAMADAAPLVGRKIETEEAARETTLGVARSVPGACPTYWLVGAKAVDVAPELTPDHAACVQQDLKRRDGMGARYGEGTFRALEGALALYRDAERALRIGLAKMAPDVRPKVEAKLSLIQAATQKSETKKVLSRDRQHTLDMLGHLHADAGVGLPREVGDAGADARDAGGDGAGDGGTPSVRPPPLKRPIALPPKKKAK